MAGNINALFSETIRPIGVLSDPTATAVFLGENSATANQLELSRAKLMEADGVNRDKIWYDTGWGRRPSGHWFYEVDDRFFSKLPNKSPLQNNELAPFFSRYSHPEVVNAYPKLNNLLGVVTSDLLGLFGMNGAYGKLPNGNPTITLNTNQKDDVVLHELQHAITDAAKWPMGYAEYLYDSKSHKKIPKQNGDFWKVREPGSEKLNGVISVPYAPRDFEVEARNVSRRRHLSSHERRQIPPWKTQDFDDEDQPTQDYPMSKNRNFRIMTRPPDINKLMPLFNARGKSNGR